MKVGNRVYVEACLITLPDRMNDVVVQIINTSGRKTDVECSAYEITSDKPNTRAILRELDFEYMQMIKDSNSYEEKSMITQIFGRFEQIIKVHQ